MNAGSNDDKESFIFQSITRIKTTETHILTHPNAFLPPHPLSVFSARALQMGVGLRC